MFTSTRLSITDGESIELALTSGGLPCELIRQKESPLTLTYDFKTAEINGVSRKLKSIVADVALLLHTRVAVADPDNENADFSIIVEKKTRDSVGWENYKSKMTKKYDFIIGIDTNNAVQRLNLDELPHLLIAGASGTGKSVALHTIIKSLINNHRNRQENLKFVMIDTKKTELTQYKNNPFCLCTITSQNAAVVALNNLNKEMQRRYSLMAKKGQIKSDEFKYVVIIDELADLMMFGGRKLVEPLLVRLAQMGRAANIHLILATQRPTVDVCTGHLKANIPTRLALMTASSRDSINIVDRKGAETLKGKGDALLMLPSQNNLIRLQCFNNN